MCGLVGIVGKQPVNQALYDGLTMLQHRGQDAAGIMTIDGLQFRLRKGDGLVRDVFRTRHMKRLSGHLGIAHTRYPDKKGTGSGEAQPFYVNSPFGLALAHNGNLTNSSELQESLFKTAKRHINTQSDAEILLNVFAHELSKSDKPMLDAEDIFAAVSRLHQQVKGAYAVVSMLVGHGVIAFRDPNGIRPLALGKRESRQGTEYIVASESVAIDGTGFTFLRDILPGEAVYITEKGELHSAQCADSAQYHSCIFEYVYFARPDSFIDGVSVYASRLNMGKRLGQKIKRDYSHLDIDVVIPIPETASDTALEVSRVIRKPYRQGFVKNRYIGRTFIMPGQIQRRKSVRRKLNTINSEFKDKNVLLVDDSIVRGTTSEQIIEMARGAGAKHVYFASAAPAIRYPNVYGIDMPTVNELIAYNRTEEEIRELIQADALIYQDLKDLIASVQQENPDLKEFDASVFDGRYITGDVDQTYLDELGNLAKLQESSELDDTNLDLYNED